MATGVNGTWTSLTNALKASFRPLSEAEISRTISLARITLIAGLVFLHYEEFPNLDHSPFDGVKPGEYGVATYLNSLFLFFFFSAVPLLSTVSGWLFFSFSAETARSALLERMRRRFLSLYLPLVFWNAIFFSILYIVFLLAPNDPLLEEINLSFESSDLSHYVNAVFAITGRPVGFHFWFVRDLFVTVLVSPILWILLQRAPYTGAVLLLLAWLTGFVLPIFLRMDVPLFFYLGGVLRLKRVPLAVGWRTTLVFLVAYLIMVAVRAGAPLFLDDATYANTGELAAATRLMRLAGVIAAWGLLQRAAETDWGQRLARLGALSFFLYSVHFPLLAQVKIVLWRFVPSTSDVFMLAHYLTSVLLTIALGLGLAFLLAQKAPRVFATFNGGRGFG